MGSKVEAPKKAKGLSKKNKKAWRKNTDINEIEDFLDDQRLEVRLGGSFDTRKDDELFTVNSLPLSELEQQRVKRRSRVDKPLKCFQHLTNTSKVPDPIVKRNHTKKLQERRNPIVVQKEEKARIQGIVKPKDKLIKKHREADKLRKAASILERTTRRRTQFDFDLWDAPEVQVVKKVNENEWLETATKAHMLINLGKTNAVKKPPKDLRDKTSKLSAVEAPHPGASYNPSLKDHNDLLWKSAVIELMKEKEQHRIDFHTTMMFPSKKDAPTEKSWLAEMSEGVEILSKRGKAVIEAEPSNDGNQEDGSEDDETEKGELETKDQKPKTRQQRRKAKKQREELLKKSSEKTDSLRELEVFRIKSIKKELNVKDQEIKRRQEIRKAKKEQKQYLPAQLSRNKFEPQEMELKLTSELTGNLRTLKPEGNVLLDRYKSLQKRNIIETTMKYKIEKNKKKRKKVEKRSYKMGFEWEKK